MATKNALIYSKTGTEKYYNSMETRTRYHRSDMVECISAKKLANKYGLNDHTMHKIKRCILIGISTSEIEKIIEYAVKVLSNSSISNIELSDAIYNLLYYERLISIELINKKLSICVNEGFNIEEVFLSSRILSENIRAEDIYSMIKLTKRVSDEVNLSRLERVFAKMSDEKKESLRRFFPLTKRTQLIAYNNLKNKINIKVVK